MSFASKCMLPVANSLLCAYAAPLSSTPAAQIIHCTLNMEAPPVKLRNFVPAQRRPVHSMRHGPHGCNRLTSTAPGWHVVPTLEHLEPLQHRLLSAGEQHFQCRGRHGLRVQKSL